MPALGTYVTLKAAQPLPSGRTVKLRCYVRWAEADGRYTVQCVTPGMYEGARFTVTADEIETT